VFRLTNAEAVELYSGDREPGQYIRRLDIEREALVSASPGDRTADQDEIRQDLRCDDCGSYYPAHTKPDCRGLYTVKTTSIFYNPLYMIHPARSAREE
jgi:hypothetical protein